MKRPHYHPHQRWQWRKSSNALLVLALLFLVVFPSYNVIATNDITEQEYQDFLHLHGDTTPTNDRKLGKNLKFTLNVLVLLLQFTNHANRELPKESEYQVLLNLRTKRYLEVNSFNKFSVWFDVQKWDKTDQTEIHYAQGIGGRGFDLQKCFHPLLNRLDASGFDFGPHDQNGDGVIDQLMVLTSSYDAILGETDVDGTAQMDRIWSWASPQAGEPKWNGGNSGVGTNAFLFASAYSGLEGAEPANPGVVLHEFFHSWGNLPDLYNWNAQQSDLLGNGIGYLGMMDEPYGTDSQNDDIPVHLCAWSKQFLGWITPVNANAQGSLTKEYTLRPAELHDDAIRIDLDDFFRMEYFLLENRQRLLFDKDLHGTGLVIYRVNEMNGVDINQGVGDPSTNDYKPYLVMVEQADGLYQLEKGENHGDQGDFWPVGSTMGSNTDGQTYPNTDMYSNGIVQETGVIIEVVAQNGLDITVKITIPDNMRFAPPKEEAREEEDAFAFLAPHRESNNNNGEPIMHDFRRPGTVDEVPLSTFEQAKEEQVLQTVQDQASGVREATPSSQEYHSSHFFPSSGGGLAGAGWICFVLMSALVLLS